MNNIKDKLMQDFKASLKDSNVIRKNTIQLLRASILTEEKRQLKSLEDNEIEDILLKEKTKRLDAIEQFKKANRQDLIEQTQKEVYYISEYLPQPLSETELRNIIDNEISKIQNASIKEMGIIIRNIKNEYGSRATGSQISEIVKEKLS